MDNSQDVSSTGAAGAALMGTFMVVWLLFVCAIIAVSIWLYWRILTKAGFNGALALLMLIPGIGGLIIILMLAFGEWPALQGRTPVQTGYIPPAPTT